MPLSVDFVVGTVFGLGAAERPIFVIVALCFAVRSLLVRRQKLIPMQRWIPVVADVLRALSRDVVCHLSSLEELRNISRFVDVDGDI